MQSILMSPILHVLDRFVKLYPVKSHEYSVRDVVSCLIQYVRNDK